MICSSKNLIISRTRKQKPSSFRAGGKRGKGAQHIPVPGTASPGTARPASDTAAPAPGTASRGAGTARLALSIAGQRDAGQVRGRDGRGQPVTIFALHSSFILGALPGAGSDSPRFARRGPGRAEPSGPRAAREGRAGGGTDGRTDRQGEAAAAGAASARPAQGFLLMAPAERPARPCLRCPGSPRSRPARLPGKRLLLISLPFPSFPSLPALLCRCPGRAQGSRGDRGSGVRAAVRKEF